PDFLLRDLTLRAQAGYDLGVDYAFKYHGPRAALGLEYALLRSHVVLTASYNFQYLIFYDLSNPNAFNDPDIGRRFLGYTSPYRPPLCSPSPSRPASRPPGPAVDSRDQPLDPSRGVYVASTAEVGAEPLGSQFSYEKVLGDLRLYYTIAARLTLSGRLLYGALF